MRGVEKLVVGQLQACKDTQFNDLTTRRLLLVGSQLQRALTKALTADVQEVGGAEKPEFPLSLMV